MQTTPVINPIGNNTNVNAYTIQLQHLISTMNIVTWIAIIFMIICAFTLYFLYRLFFRHTRRAFRIFLKDGNIKTVGTRKPLINGRLDYKGETYIWNEKKSKTAFWGKYCHYQEGVSDALDLDNLTVIKIPLSASEIFQILKSDLAQKLFTVKDLMGILLVLIIISIVFCGGSLAINIYDKVTTPSTPPICHLDNSSIQEITHSNSGQTKILQGNCVITNGQTVCT